MLVGKTAWCQNLVPNPSFEKEDSLCCSSDLGFPCFTTSWLYYGQSPDYYNSCFIDSNNYIQGIPQNMAGNQQAIGSGYWGLFTKALGQSYPNYREVIGTMLLQPMAIGGKYFVSMKVALADSCNCATNNIGFYFSTTADLEVDSFPAIVPNYAQVFSNSIIESTDWVIVSGAFIADQPYQFVFLGNFFDDVSTDTLVYAGRPFTAVYNAGHPGKCWSYYYIDDVCVSTDSLECDLSTSLHQPVQSNFSIYPNPSHQAVNLTLPQGTKQVEIFNAVGQSVYSRNVISLRQVVDVSLFSEGVYFVKIQSHQGVQTQKFVVQR